LLIFFSVFERLHNLSGFNEEKLEILNEQKGKCYKATTRDSHFYCFGVQPYR
jgi:hypothetical protein